MGGVTTRLIRENQHEHARWDPNSTLPVEGV